MLLYYGHSSDACFQQVRMATVKEDRSVASSPLLSTPAITMLTLIFTRIGSLATGGTEDVQ